MHQLREVAVGAHLELQPERAHAARAGILDQQRRRFRAERQRLAWMRCERGWRRDRHARNRAGHRRRRRIGALRGFARAKKQYCNEGRQPSRGVESHYWNPSIELSEPLPKALRLRTAPALEPWNRGTLVPSVTDVSRTTNRLPTRAP